MREPRFWWQPASWRMRLLQPVAAVYGAVAARRMAQPGSQAGIPVICVGNYQIGGAGKTPTALALAQLLRAAGERPFFLTRGYGGEQRGPLLVDGAHHRAADVGDEPLLLAREAPTIVAADRVAGAARAREGGASVIVMDDGFQNPALSKDVTFVVIDARRGLGNGAVFPAGPLRAPLSPQLARTDALIVVGEGGRATSIAAAVQARGVPVFAARLAPEPESVARVEGQRVRAFCGIGDPERFFETLRGCGAEVAETGIYPDHHAFTAAELADERRRAEAGGLKLVTTAKDAARLSGDAALAQAAFDVFRIRMAFAETAAVAAFLARRLAAARVSATRA